METLLGTIEGKGLATQTTLAQILRNLYLLQQSQARYAYRARWRSESALAAGWQNIAAPATEAKQTALNALIGEVQAAPANTLSELTTRRQN